MIHHAIRRRILVPLGLGMAIVAAVMFIGFYQHAQHDLLDGLRTESASIQTLLDMEVEERAHLLRSQIELLEATPCVQQALADRVRPALLHCSEPLLERMRANHHINRLYFHSPERINFLRVHYPPRHGDAVEYPALLERAEATGSAHGIELGPLGHFSLRLIRPWRLDDRLLGYVEVGQEIRHLPLKIKDILGTDLILLIGKQHLIQLLWEEGQRQAGYAPEWGRLRDYAIIDRTTELWDAKLEELLAADRQKTNDFELIQFTRGTNQYAAYRLPLRNSAGLQLGHILAIKDITEKLDDIRRLSLLVASIGLGVAVLLFVAFGNYLGRLQHTLVTTHGNLEREVRQHAAAEQRLLENQTLLDEEIEQRKRVAAEEHTLGILLRLSLQPLPLENFLEQALTALITTVPWLSLMPKGGVFLAHGEHPDRRLELTAEYNLSPQTIAACGNIAFGSCLCGRAAASGEIQFAADVDEHHTIQPAHMQPHGHYNIPIKHNDSILGVIVLYLRPGYRSSDNDRNFLERSAAVFSMGILRRYGEEALVEARRRAEAATKAKSSFLATMSHEIRTPLNGVLGMADLLLDTELDVDQREFATVISQSGRNLLGIINDILDFSKGEAARLVLAPIPFNLETTIHDVVELYTAQIKDKDLDVILDYAPDCPQYLFADAGRIRQILLNLVGNAVKFTAQGHILIKVSGQLESNGDWVALYVTVEDSGIGFEPENAKHIFDAFTQADAGTNRRYGGTGLGLAICKQLVELMGGEIGAIGTPGQGAKFWFALTLPLAAPPQPLPKAALADVPILLLDADTLSHTIVCRQLTLLGLRVSAARDQAQALASLREAAATDLPFQLVLIDHPLPQLDIEGFAHSVLSTPELAATPLVLMTSLAYRGDAAHFEQIGFAGYVTKPIQLSVLCQVLSAALAKRGVPDGRTPLITRHRIAEDNAAPPMRGRVLVVDDNEINRRVASTFLRRLGLEADSVENGEAAVQRAATGAYDLILMDLHMPGLDGYQATRLIREQERDGKKRLPIVALTASGVGDVRPQCTAAGMDDYLTKPFEEAALLQVLRNWLPMPVPGETG